MPPFDEDQRFTGFDSAVNFVSDLALNALVLPCAAQTTSTGPLIIRAALAAITPRWILGV